MKRKPVAVEKATHTPGPWTAHEMTHFGESGTGFWNVQPIGEPDDTWSEADARLVASAPDLLAALKAAQQFIYPDIGRGPAILGWENTIDMVTAAIAKAEGDA